jgi:3D (Asp-Asp-Asp) domain-containing protein
LRRWLSSLLVAVNVMQYSLYPPTLVNLGGERVLRPFKVTFYCSCSKCTGKSSPQRGGRGLTRLGNAPVAFRSAATGDPALLGKWVHFDDLGGWVHLSDTGSAVKRNQVDLFIGGPEMHKHALRLGVVEWWGEVR